MSKKPNLLDTITGISTKRDTSMPSKSVDAIETKSDPVEEIPGAVQAAKPTVDKTLPKMTIYADERVLKAIRLIAVEDGVQAQVILRRAVRDYLATRGHNFTDLAKGV